MNTLTGSLSSAALLIDALPALDTAQRDVGNAQQAIHLLGGVFVGVPLMVHQYVVRLPDLSGSRLAEAADGRGQREHPDG